MNTIQKIFAAFLLLIIVINTGCKKDKNEDENSNPLFGKWEWVTSSGGIAGQIITPGSVGYTVTLEYTANGQYYYYKNDTLTISDIYTIKATTNNNPFDYIIEYGDSNSYPDQFLNLPENNTLRLIDNCLDCYDNVYVKKE